MNTPNNPDNSNVSDHPIFEPFPEPQTMPKGWDFSGILTAPAPATTKSAGATAES